MPASKLFSTYLSLDGAGVTFSIVPATDAVATYSFLAPGTGSVLHVARMLISIEDTGNFDAEDYGAMGSALTNGITLGVYDTNGLKYLITHDGAPIKSNFGWASYCYDADVKNWGVGNNMLTARWTFEKYGKPIYLRQDRGEYIAASVKDTMSTLVDHRILMEGHYISTGPISP